MDKLIDLSQPIANDMPVYPGDRETKLYRVNRFETDHYNDFRLETCMHAGTHMDSPMHMSEKAVFISELPLETFIAKGCLLDARGDSIIRLKKEYAGEVKESCIVLIYTGYDRFYGQEKYYSEHPVIDTDLCGFLIERKIKAVGLDLPSPDKYPFPVHKALFENGICILENLTNLYRLINVKDFEVMAFPLRINTDSSPVRAVARMRDPY